VGAQSCVMVVVTSVMWAGTTAAIGSPNEARQRWSSSAMSGGNRRITPMLMPSLRCPFDVAAFAVTLLTEDIDLADSLGAGAGQETPLGVRLAHGHGGNFPGLVRAEAQQPVQLRGIVQQFLGPVPDRGQVLRDH